MITIPAKPADRPSWRAVALFVVSLAFTGSAVILLATAWSGARPPLRLAATERFGRDVIRLTYLPAW